jgi:hypothetical protein
MDAGLPGPALLGCWQRQFYSLCASQDKVSRNLYWIWFVGAAAWFLDAALILHHHALGRGLVAAAVSATFLAAGMFFKSQAGR